MSEAQMKTDDEEKTIPKPEGYTFVKYSYLFVWELSAIGAFSLVFILVRFNTPGWLFWVAFFGLMILFWIVGHKLTEVKVTLKITEKGLEQIRLSGSRLWPKYRMIEWKMMRRFHLYGGGRANEFKISIREGRNFRVSIPVITIFEKQKNNFDSYAAFANDFWDIAPQHNVHRGFFY
jgi:hypothetical protein